MKDALAVHRELLSRGIAHEIVHLHRAIVSADELPDALGLPGSQCVAVRMYEVDDRLCAICVPAGTEPAPHSLVEATGGTRIGVASVDRVNAATDCTAGLVTPVVLPPDVDVIIDASFHAFEVVYAPTGDSGTALGIHLTDLLAASNARVTSLRATATVDLDEHVTAGRRTRR